MAKTATSNTRSPFDIAPKRPVTEREAREVMEMLNYAQCNTPVMLVATHAGSAGWDTGVTSLANHRVTWPAAGTTTPYERFRLWIDPDCEQIVVSARASFPASNTGRLEVVVGGATANLTFAAGATTLQTATLATSSTGTGEVSCQVRTVRLTGSDTSASLQAWSIRHAVIAASNLPDPDPTS